MMMMIAGSADGKTVNFAAAAGISIRTMMKMIAATRADIAAKTTIAIAAVVLIISTIAVAAAAVPALARTATTRGGHCRRTTNAQRAKPHGISGATAVLHR